MLLMLYVWFLNVLRLFSYQLNPAARGADRSRSCGQIKSAFQPFHLCRPHLAQLKAHVLYNMMVSLKRRNALYKKRTDYLKIQDRLTCQYTQGGPAGIEWLGSQDASRAEWRSG